MVRYLKGDEYFVVLIEGGCEYQDKGANAGVFGWGDKGVVDKN